MANEREALVDHEAQSQQESDDLPRGCTCGTNKYQVFWINRNTLMLIIQVLSVVLGTVSAGLNGNETATLVLGIVVAALNGIAMVIKADPGGEQGREAKPAGLF